MNIQIRWDPPHVINRPITSYTVYYTNNGNQPIKNWQKMEVREPNHNAIIENLRPNTQYFIRLRANDQMGPGRLGNPASVNTLKP
ncbi:fibronectin type III domain protein, partial [Ancylostoma duodenale]